jgi:nucleotide-binding universal stress UspA family protein
MGPVVTAEDMKEMAIRGLDMESKNIDPQAETVVRTECREALSADGILAATADHHADLVVMGMKKESAVFRRVFGSTVTALIKRSRIPMVIVPEDAAFRDIERIVLAYDGDLAPDDDVHVLDAVKQLGHRFGSQVFLVHVADTEFREIYQILNKPFRLIRIMHTLAPVLETVRSKSVTEALQLFLEQHHAGMLALMPEKKSLLKRLFQGSTTRSVVFNSKVPLLILPGYHEGKSLWWTKTRVRSIRAS